MKCVKLRRTSAGAYLNLVTYVYLHCVDGLETPQSWSPFKAVLWIYGVVIAVRHDACRFLDFKLAVLSYIS